MSLFLNMNLFQLKKMKLVLFLVLQLFVVTRGYTADEDYCTDYVIVSIAQYWQSVDEHCGFKGSRWSSNYQGQYDWCVAAHEWVADNETEARDRMLEECRAVVTDTPATNAVITETKIVQPNESAKSTDTDLHVRKVVPAVDNQVEDSEKKGDKAKHSLNIALWYAVAENDLNKVQSLVKEGADLQYVIHDKSLINELKAAYHLDKGKDKSNIVYGADPYNPTIADVTTKSVTNEHQEGSIESESLISYAVSKGLVEVGLWLLKQEIGPIDNASLQKLKNDLLGIALINAVKNKQNGNVVLLLEKGAAIDYDLDMNFGTPLYFAVIQGATKIAKVLLAQGADSNYTTNGGQNMMNYSVENIELLTLLLDHGADPNNNGESAYSNNLPLVHAIKLGNLAAVELLLKHGAKMDIYDVDEPYPLLQAITEQQSQIVELLIKSGANVNVVYNSDSSKSCALSKNNLIPMDEAIKTGNEGIMLLLKKSGAKTEEEICPKS